MPGILQEIGTKLEQAMIGQGDALTFDDHYTIFTWPIKRGGQARMAFLTLTTRTGRELQYLKSSNTPTTTQSEEEGETRAVYCGNFGSKRFHRQNH